MSFDQNGDGKLTREELAVRSARGGKMQASNPSNQRDNRSQTSNAQQPRSDEGKEKAPDLFEKITSYRMADKDGIPNDRLAYLSGLFERTPDSTTSIDERVCE